VSGIGVSAIDRARLGLVLGGSALTLAWILVAVVIRVVRQPRAAPTGPPTLEPGPEPPAVSNLLTHNFRPTRDALAATVIDLAARGVVEIEKRPPHGYACRLRSAATEDLAPWERRVLGVLEEKAVNGIVPTAALTTGTAASSRRWWKGFVKDVQEETKARGLSRDIWDAGAQRTVLVLALLPLPLFALAAFNLAAIPGYLVPAAVVYGTLVNDRQRDTTSGLERASVWLGFRAKLRENPSFPALPPTAVAIWERILAHGAAVGVAEAAVRAIPMGPEDDRRAWSAYGGEWREVRVRYGRRPGWGASPAGAIFAGVLALAVCAGIGFGLLTLWRFLTDQGLGLGLEAAGRQGLEVTGVERIVGWALLGIGAVLALIAARSLLVLVSGVIDAVTPDRVVTGELIRLRMRGSEESRTYHGAVYDGSATRVRAYLLEPLQFGALAQGQVVRAVVTRTLGHVRAIDPVPQPAGAPGPLVG